MAEKTATIESTILALTEAKKFSTLRDILSTMNPADVAAVFEDLDEAAMPVLFRLLPKELAAEAFAEMDPDFQEVLIHSFSDNELKEVINEMYVDDAADLVEDMPANVVKRILRSADPEMRRQINEILRYPEDSAGSIMTTEYVSLRPKMTVLEAIKRIRRTGIDKETINTCFVTDDGKLIGTVSIRTLILADTDELVANIMTPDAMSVTTSEDRETVVQLFSKYNFFTMPVVDKDNRLVGIVTIDDVVHVMEEETTEDIEKMAGMLPSDRPYMHTGVIDTWKSRIPWLLVLMLSATLTGIVMNHFETQLGAMLILSSFIPMLTDTAGNSGTQASVAIIRGIALAELDIRDWPQIIWKEIRVAVLCGLCLGIANFGKMMLIDRMLLHNGVTVMVAAAVCVTLVFVIFVAKCVGCTLPLIVQKFGADPAVVASPFITTIVDVLALLLYFSVASALLGI